MKNITRKIIFLFCCLTFLSLPALSNAKNKSQEKEKEKDKTVMTQITPSILEKAQANNNWKTAFITGKFQQVVFMNITPETNPNNEVGDETHNFDQIIFVVQGNGKAVLKGRESMIKSGDLIYIAAGTPHNIINLNSQAPLKIMSIYSSMDIPAGAIYKIKADQPKN